MRHWLVVVAVVATGCDATPVRVQRAALNGAHTLVVDFDGAVITSGPSDDSIAGVSSLGSATVPAFQASIVAPGIDVATLEDVLVDRVRSLYLPFDLDVVKTAPSSGDYARVLVGGTSTILSPAVPSGAAGIAAEDCGDANLRSVGFAFSDEASPQFGGPVALAATIAHEAGHGFGLEHTTSPTDPMYAVGSPTQTLADLFGYAFGTGDYSPFLAGGGNLPEQCGRTNPIDDHAILVAALGPRAATSALPTVSIDYPPPVAAVPTMLPLRIAASDDVAVRRVEVYRDLTLAAVLTTAPYEVTLDLPAADATRLTVEAVDDDGQRASVALTFAVDTTIAAPCDDADPCSGGRTCVDNACVVASVDAASAPDLAMPPSMDDGGCDVARYGSRDAVSIVLVFAVFAIVVLLRNRRR